MKEYQDTQLHGEQLKEVFFLSLWNWNIVSERKQKK